MSASVNPLDPKDPLRLAQEGQIYDWPEYFLSDAKALGFNINDAVIRMKLWELWQAARNYV